MSDGELKFPRWQGPLRDLILEFDREKFLQKMREVEIILLKRRELLGPENNAYNEQEAIAIRDALSMLRIVKLDRLNLPRRPGRYPPSENSIVRMPGVPPVGK